MTVLVIYQVLRRAGNFAFARPTREVLFTVVAREDKYKAKSFIDTVIYRTGDQLGAWAYAALGFAGLGMTGISVVAVPLSLLWLFNSVWLGRTQEKLATLKRRPPDGPEIQVQIRAYVPSRVQMFQVFKLFKTFTVVLRFKNLN